MTGKGRVVLSVDSDEVRLTSMRKNVERARALYRQHVINDLCEIAYLPLDDLTHLLAGESLVSRLL